MNTEELKIMYVPTNDEQGTLAIRFVGFQNGFYYGVPLGNKDNQIQAYAQAYSTKTELLAAKKKELEQRKQDLQKEEKHLAKWESSFLAEQNTEAKK
jgi:hypothetical protein